MSKKKNANEQMKAWIDGISKMELSVGEKQPDTTICPKCKSEETFQSQDWLGREIRECEDCGCEYEINYELKVRSITIK